MWLYGTLQFNIISMQPDVDVSCMVGGDDSANNTRLTIDSNSTRLTMDSTMSEDSLNVTKAEQKSSKGYFTSLNTCVASLYCTCM